MEGEVVPDEVEPEPELPVLPVLLESPDEVDPDVVVVVAPLPLPDAPVVEVALEPACSFATTTPMRAVRPVAASTEARVTVRTRDRAFWRSEGVGCGVSRDMAMGDLRSGDAPT